MLEKYNEQKKQYGVKIERIKHYKSLLYSVNERQSNLGKILKNKKQNTSKLSNLDSYTLRKEKNIYYSNENYIRFLTIKIDRIESS